MDLKEALIYFPLLEDEDALDKWEELLFEHKQFFLTRAAIPKVFQSKLKKISQQYDAFRVVAEDDLTPQVINYDSFTFSNEVGKAFQEMFAYRGQFKQDVLKCVQAQDIQLVVNKWLEVELAYAALWAFDFPDDLERPVISKAPDPMLLMGSIRSWDENRHKSFTELKKDFDVLPKVLKDELKRLSLLLKLNG